MEGVSIVNVMNTVSQYMLLFKCRSVVGYSFIWSVCGPPICTPHLYTTYAFGSRLAFPYFPRTLSCNTETHFCPRAWSEGECVITKLYCDEKGFELGYTSRTVGETEEDRLAREMEEREHDSRCTMFRHPSPPLYLRRRIVEKKYPVRILEWLGRVVKTVAEQVFPGFAPREQSFAHTK